MESRGPRKDSETWWENVVWLGLKEPLIAYFDYETEGEPGRVDDLINAGIAFRLWTAMFAVEKGRWPVIDSQPPPPSLLESPWFFKTDPISGEITKMLRGGMDEVPATPPIGYALVWFSSILRMIGDKSIH